MTQNESSGLDLAFQNQVYCTRDVNFLNNFENVLTNKIVCKSELFCQKKKKKKKKTPKLAQPRF